MTTRLRILVLGGTGFIGPHFVHAALARGHTVSVFSRGREHCDFPERVERLTGDRNVYPSSIMNRDWDAVLDLACYVPNWVRTLGDALRGRVKHYTFISTIVAYKFPGASDERSELLAYTGDVNPYSLTWQGNQYGALKVLCEREAELQFPGKTLIVRPGHIVGPGEHIGVLTYWIARMQHGGEVLASGDPKTQVQLIDVRDLAQWVVRMVESGATGAFTAVGPALPLSWAEMLGAVRAMFSVPITLTWVAEQWLADGGVSPISCLRLWSSELGLPGYTRLSNKKASASGLEFRALSATLTDCHAWYQQLPAERRKDVTLGFDQLNQAVEYSMERESELLAAWKCRR